MAKNEKTSKKVAKKASQVLTDDRYSKKSKSVAGSALSQAPDKKKAAKKSAAKKSPAKKSAAKKSPAKKAAPKKSAAKKKK